MKKLFKLLFLTIAIFTTTFSKDNSLEKIQKKGEIIIGLDDTFAPMGFKDENGNIIGFDIDLANEVAKRMGVKATFKPSEWDGIIFDLRSKKIDLVWNGMTITPTREKQILFSEPYFDDDQIVIVKNSSIQTLDDLNSKDIGVQMGSTSYFAFEASKYSKDVKEIKKYSTNVEALLDLEAGRTDAVIMDAVVGRYYIAKKDGFTIVNEPIAREKMGVGLRKEDISLKNEIDKILNEMRVDGTFKEIYRKWFGEQ
ncbi:amino acid ABC transporter substrate-binding protein [Cetobacterium sp.]|uniref:amino acid ABC transporter substrate-binding protein n=1 Tax=Cetobacterium sp. TaxID=2071632 RepID=UPI003F34873E